MLLTDQDQPLDIALLDADGKPISQGEVECSISQIAWRWWWEKGTENLAEYQSAETQHLIAKDVVQVKNGKATWKFNVKYPAWGRFLIKAKDLHGGHATAKIVYIDWPGWAGRGQKDADGAAMLSLTVPKPKYSVGEAVAVSFPSNEHGSALVSIERAGKILREEWIKTGADTTQYRFTATEAMSPNVYVHVTFLQEHAQTANDLPIRLYGIAPVMIENPASHLRPVIETDSVLRPKEAATFTVSEANSKPMTYTVAIVDEGLLGLTRFRAQDPWSTFYKKEASFLKSWDLYSFVSGAFSGKLETLLAVGGSDDGISGANRKPTRFSPVTLYFGPYTLAAGESQTHSFTLPDYIGSVRLMVIAGNKGAYGSAEKSVPVKTDLMLLGTLPRVLSPRETVTVPVSLFSSLSGASDVSVSAKVIGSGQILGASEKKAKVSSGGEGNLEFTLKAGDKPGALNVMLTAVSGAASASQTISLEVRSVTLPVTRVYAKTIEKKKDWKESIPLGFLPGTSAVKLEVSSLPPLNLQARLSELIQYPHGCVEQTTSSVFPQLYLPQVQTLTKAQQAEIDKNVNAGIERLKLFQTSEGGFSFWPGEEDSQAWATNYAGHFLVEAKRAGYAVPDTLLKPWMKAQKNRAQGFSSEEPEALYTQAYRLFTLALAKSPDVASMNRLRERANLSVAASWRLAGAYWLAGQRGDAQNLAKNLGVKISPYRELDNTFGSDTRDLAMILETMNFLGNNTDSGAIALELSKRLSDGRWMSTQELAYSLIALLPYEGNQVVNEGLKFYYGAGSDDPKDLKLMESTDKIAQVSLPSAGIDRFTVRVKNEGNAPLFARVVTTGTPAIGEERESSNGLGLNVNYYNLSGDEIQPEELAQGADMEIRATVTNASLNPLKGLALSQLVPSGWEIINYRLAQGKPDLETIKPDSGGGDDSEEADDQSDYEEDEAVDAGDSGNAQAAESAPLFDYQDVRDDRVYTYFSLKKGESKTFVMRVHSTYSGEFYLPGTKVEAMYDGSIQATEPGRWLGKGSKTGSGRYQSGR
jgi:uncharacterized protein YfaS (alpha-2-macroglobulin family)